MSAAPPATLRERIAATLTAFAAQPLSEAAPSLFTLLGYESRRQMRFPSRTAFLAEFATGKPDFADRFPVLATAGSSAIFLQQLTNDEIAANSSGQLDLVASDVPELGQVNSYLFLAFPLPSAAYTQSELSTFARALNSLFAQPVLILFRHGEHLSIAVTNRRRSKTDSTRDVIERRVTLIREIAFAHPHPGHIAILEDFSLPVIARARQREIRTFADLDDAWRDSISTELLTKRFYREVQNWYFWARNYAEFPKDAKPDADGKHSLQLIRLLTRLLFCWFLREKVDPKTGRRLLPDELFDEPRIRELLRDTSPDASTYYLAILQNLFFATLNTPRTDEDGKPLRKFIEEAEEEADDPADVHGIQHFWRHQKLLRDKSRFEELFRAIPFLNGGLFECLDEILTNKAGRKIGELRIDGFSVKPSKQPRLPNFLFFGPARTDVDLADAYGDSSRQHETVRPLLEIFRHYKFTLTESTPLDELVELQPDLLGHVFENLLAAYNPETGTIARKATGSFYTPDLVVDWMVDQALLGYLEERLLAAHPAAAEVAPRLRDLLAWDVADHAFTAAEVETLIAAIHGLRALDPACGSGAFPMGLLQKLVMVLRTLDPRNRHWRARNLADAEAIASAPAREAALKAITRAFAHDDDNYGRKLYLIERCLFGVDIQPIATQIAKLRFFLSLVVDQQIDASDPEGNYGILPLPNLETKIVAANTLLNLQRGQSDLDFGNTTALQDELERVRHRYFTARSYPEKKALKADDARLRTELADALTSSGECSKADARRLADWNPYDQNASAPFFDPGWMFGLSRQRGFQGFDIAIGNPPYVRQEELKSVLVTDSEGKERSLKDVFKANYACFGAQADLYVYFFERTFQLLRTGGVLSFISSNKFFRSGYGERLRTFFLYATRPRVILDFGDAPVFTAIAYPSIFVAQKTKHIGDAKALPKEALKPAALPPAEWKARVLNWDPAERIAEFPQIFAEESFRFEVRNLRPDGWQFGSDAALTLLGRLQKFPTLREHCSGRVYRGIITGLNEAFFIDRETRDRLIDEDESSAKLIKPLLRGRDIKRWRVEPEDHYAIIFPFGFHERLSEYPAILAHLTSFKKALKARGQCTSSRGGGDEGQHHWLELDNNPKPEYLAEFDQPKIIVPAITGTVNYAPDYDGYFCNNKATIFIPPSVPYALAIANSQVSWWFARQRFATKQGGFYDFEPRYSATTPIPSADPEQKRLIERLSEILIWLHSPKAPTDVPQRGLIAAYFEQWLNGLVYELFFSDELHARQLQLFAETAKLAPPRVGELRNSENLRAFFLRAYDSKGRLRAQLDSLTSLEIVQLIEDSAATAVAD